MAEENITVHQEKVKKSLLKTPPSNVTLSLVEGNICIHVDDAHYVNGGYDIISEELNDMFDKCVEIVFAGDPNDIINNKNIYINDLERKVNILEEKFNTEQQNRINTQCDLEAITQEKEKYRTDYTQLLEEHAALDEEYKHTVKQLEVANNNITSLTEQRDIQNNQLKFFSDERATILPKLGEDAEKINELTKQLEEVTKQRDNYKEDCTCSEEDYRKLSDEHRDTEEELEECREALQDAEQECEDLRKHFGVIAECLEDINALNAIIDKNLRKITVQTLC